MQDVLQARHLQPLALTTSAPASSVRKTPIPREAAVRYVYRDRYYSLGLMLDCLTRARDSGGSRERRTTERLTKRCAAQCTPCPLGSTSPAGSTGEEACHFSMAFAYKLTREEYQIAAEKLKNAIGPFKSARVCIRPFLMPIFLRATLDFLIMPSVHRVRAVHVGYP